MEEARLITRQEAADMLNVSFQTISNYIEKGIIRAHRIPERKRRVFIDRNSIVALLDNYEDLEEMRRAVEDLTKELAEERDMLCSEVSEVMAMRDSLGRRVPKKQMSFIVRTLNDMAYDMELLVSREHDVLDGVISGKDYRDLARMFDVSEATISLVFLRAMRKLATLQSYPRVHAEYKRLLKENGMLRDLVRQYEQDGRHKTIDIDEVLDSPSPVPEYTFRKLFYVFDTKLVNERLSVRALGALRFAEVETVEQLVSMTKEELLQIRNLGRKTMSELDEYVCGLGLSFGMDTKEMRRLKVKSEE